MVTLDLDDIGMRALVFVRPHTEPACEGALAHVTAHPWGVVESPSGRLTLDYS